MKTTKYIALLLISTLCITFQSCDYDQYPYTSISGVVIYSPNSVLAMEYVELICTPNDARTEILYDTIRLTQNCEYYNTQFQCKEQERKKWKVFKSAPDYQYLKITRISGNEKVYVLSDRMIYVNDSLISLTSEQLTHEQTESIIESLQSIDRGVLWDDSKQHKISRFAADWSLDPEHQKDSKTAITID